MGLKHWRMLLVLLLQDHILQQEVLVNLVGDYMIVVCLPHQHIEPQGFQDCNQVLEIRQLLQLRLSRYQLNLLQHHNYIIDQKELV